MALTTDSAESGKEQLHCKRMINCGWPGGKLALRWRGCGSGSRSSWLGRSGMERCIREDVIGPQVWHCGPAIASSRSRTSSAFYQISINTKFKSQLPLPPSKYSFYFNTAEEQKKNNNNNNIASSFWYQSTQNSIHSRIFLRLLLFYFNTGGEEEEEEEKKNKASSSNQTPTSFYQISINTKFDSKKNLPPPPALID